MHLYLDSADLNELTKVLPHPLIYGVTTNPTLMARAGLRYEGLPEFVRQVADLGARRVHVQVRHADLEAMLRHAHQLAEIHQGAEIVVKIPATRDGFVAAARLTAEGTAVTMTAVYEPEQVLWSRMAGATYAAPYLGRLNDAGRDGPEVIAAMQRLLENYRWEIDDDDGGAELRLLVASVRTREAFLQLLEIGVEAVTIPPKLFGALTQHDATLAAEADFLRDAQEL